MTKQQRINELEEALTMCLVALNSREGFALTHDMQTLACNERSWFAHVKRIAEAKS